MAIRNIVKKGDEILGKKSKQVTAFDDRLHMLLDDMRDTLKQANGLGLAAVQVGVLKRLFIMDLQENGGIVEVINPQIIKQEGEQQGHEGCLSFPGYIGDLVRPMKVVVRAQDRHGNEFDIEGQEVVARCLCHEYDHLDGVLYSEKAENVRPVEA